MDLFRLIHNGDAKTFFATIKGEDLDQVNAEGRNLLHVAIARKEKGIALTLIQEGIALNLQDQNGQSPLHLAAESGDFEIAMSILKAQGNPNLMDKYGNNPLWKATFNARGNYQMVQLLMAHGANPNAKNNAGRTSLDFAMQIEDADLVEILQSQAGA